MTRDRSFKILMAEDNSDHAELAAYALQDAKVPHDLYRVNDGEEAMNYLRGLGPYGNRNEFPMPNLILLDLRMPRMDGMQVLKEIKEDPLLGAIPVAILTSSRMESDAIQAAQLRADAYLHKPVETENFIHLFEKLGF